MIIGILVAVIVVIVLVAAIVWYLNRSRNEHGEEIIEVEKHEKKKQKSFRSVSPLGPGQCDVVSKYMKLIMLFISLTVFFKFIVKSDYVYCL